MNYVTGNIGLLTCSAGVCSGTLPVVTSDPCPAVDKVSEVKDKFVPGGWFKGKKEEVTRLTKVKGGKVAVGVPARLREPREPSSEDPEHPAAAPERLADAPEPAEPAEG